MTGQEVEGIPKHCVLNKHWGQFRHLSLLSTRLRAFIPHYRDLAGERSQIRFNNRPHFSDAGITRSRGIGGVVMKACPPPQLINAHTVIN